MDAELQQRASEYLALLQRPQDAARYIQPMAPWEGRESKLIKRLQVGEHVARAGSAGSACQGNGEAIYLQFIIYLG